MFAYIIDYGICTIHAKPVLIPSCPNVRPLRKMLIMLLGKTWEDAELTLNSVEPTVQVGSTTCSFGARQASTIWKVQHVAMINVVLVKRQAERRILPVLEQS